MSEKVSKANLLQDDKTFNRNKWIFSSSGIFRDAMYSLVSTYFLQYVQFGLTLTIAQFTTISLLIGIFGRIWDGINDPMMGAIIDGTNLKWGKFKPWILIGGIIDSILTICLYTIRPKSGWVFVGVICGVYLFFEAAFTMNDIGYWSMIPSLSRTKDRRDKLTALVTFFAAMGNVLMVGLVTFLTPGNLLKSYTLFAIATGFCVATSQTLVAIFVKEAPREEKELSAENKVSLKKMFKIFFNNKQLLWMGLALLGNQAAGAIFLGLIYNLYYLEVGYDGNIIVFVVIYGMLNIVLQLLYPKIAQRFKRKQIIFVTMIFQIIGYIGMGLIGWTKILPFNLVTLCIFGLLIYLGNVPFYTATLINMSNCVEYNEYITGERNEAVVSTMRPLIVKFGDAIKYVIVTIALIASGLFAITSNVSAIETQKSMGDKVFTNVEIAREYVEEYKEIQVLKANGASIDQLNASIDDNKVLAECQVDGEFIDAVGKMYITRFDNSGKYIDSCQLESEEASSFVIDGDYKYNLLITVTDNNGVDIHNAANEIYSTENNLTTRIVLRIMISIVPMGLIIMAATIQRKKFIIDEEYFDMMIKEIEERKNTEVAK